MFKAVMVGAIAAAALLSGMSGAKANPFTLDQTFDDPTVTGFDQFGNSVALDGNNVLIGAPRDSTNPHNVGQAHLFDATTGTLLQTFDDPTPTGFDNFGSSVALDGNTVLIGARAATTNGSQVGQAHLFDATSGALLQTFDDPTVTVSDYFGASVALDGDTVLVGARADDTNGTGFNVNTGQAHLFDATSGALLQTFDDPTVTDADVFGWSVALDGDTVLIGAPRDDTNGSDVGQAHLFDATSGALLQTFDDPTVTGGDWFGHSVALDGDRVLIGAAGDDTNGSDVGQAHLFNASGALLQTFDDPTVTDLDRFGVSVALDGNNVLIGARFDNTNGRAGQAHLFDATSGALLQTFDDPTVTGSDFFGDSVALDGNTVLIGARLDDTNGSQVGQAHLFSMDDTDVPEPGTLALIGGGLVGLGLAARRRRA